MAVSEVVNLSGLLDEAKCFELVRQHRWPDGVRCPDCDSAIVICNPAYQPISPLCVDGSAGEAGGACGSAAQRADHAAHVAPVVGGPAEGPEVVGQMLGENTL